MAKNTAKKRAAGGVARRLTGPLGSPVASPPPVSPEGEAGVVQPDAHSSVSAFLACLLLLTFVSGV